MKRSRMEKRRQLIGVAEEIASEKSSLVLMTPMETQVAAEELSKVRYNPQVMVQTANTEVVAESLRNVQYDPQVTVKTRESASDELWKDEMMRKLRQAHPHFHPTRPCTIFRVPSEIQQTDPKAYAPTVVGIGPFNHQEGQKLSMAGHKWRCVRYLLYRHRDSNRADTLFDQCLQQMKALDADARNCYSENIDLDAP